MLEPDSGQVLWDGRDVLKMGKAFRRLLGFMPQQQGLYSSFTGERFLDYMCALKEIPCPDRSRGDPPHRQPGPSGGCLKEAAGGLIPGA